MNIELPLGFIKKILYPAQAQSEVWIQRCRWKNDKDSVDFRVDALSDAQLEGLVNLLRKNEGYNGMANRIVAFVNVRSDSKHEKPIRKLTLLETALIHYIKKLPNKWLYATGADGKLCPCYVNKIEHVPADQRTGREAAVHVSLFHIWRDGQLSTTAAWHQADLKGGLTVVQLLAEEGYMAETEELNRIYAAEMERYAAINHSTGTQFLATGTALPCSSFRYSTTPMVRDGEPSKVVMDDDDAEEARHSGRGSSTERAATSEFWDTHVTGTLVEDADEEEKGTVILPTHPYVKVFDLKNHEFVNIHVSNLADYTYDKSLITKLVLPDAQKDLVTILIASSNNVLEDIVRGKTGGVVVIATGEPGVGKTLTAEVCSEAIERPLYCVQCSQLGTDEENLEKKLQIVLNRASRWKAVLLIDEADVYVHERGTDIHQNAIVGVWLRLMEYYRGIMFMTSNRAVTIDDAVMSRATAWIRYELPNKESLPKIWEVLSRQYGVELNARDIDALSTKFLGISGRSVKNMLKLARLLASAKNEAVTAALIEYCATFLDIEYARKSARASDSAGVTA